MITGLDHVVVLTSDIGAGAAHYQTLFARAPAWRNSGDGAERVLFTLDNMSLELMAPAGSDANADRIRNVLAAQGEGLASLCFRTSDIARMHRRLERLTLKPEPVAEVESRDELSGASLSWIASFGFSAVTPAIEVMVDRRGPSPVSNHRSAPSACGSNRMSAKRIAASKP